ncbi:MAG: class I SAM-dependent methyltransferase [Bacteroidetes bacterium]|nr:class I SAM-dependent methyltransferase [Bacteroidota bacterium]
MLQFSQEPTSIVDGVPVFENEDKNLDTNTVKAFGEEWERFDVFSDEEISTAGKEYFDLLPDHELRQFEHALDMGCGSGRWTRYIAPHVKHVVAMDPSEACFVAKKNTADLVNVRVVKASVENIPFPDESFDLAICLGVLHHIPDTQKALSELCKKIKPRGTLLLYLYYDLSNRNGLFRGLHRLSELPRMLIHRFPRGIKDLSCDLLALFVYLPFIGLSKLCAFISENLAQKMPLSYYRNKTWNIIRNDARDRFGTPLEQRFSKSQIEEMLREANMTPPIFSAKAPFWHCVAQKA